MIITKVKNQFYNTFSRQEKQIVSHYFILEYKPTDKSYKIKNKFYLPDTEEGRKVLGLFKDAFKKGNLFAFNPFDKWYRHGRIHKKTALIGDHGYPDSNYFSRVIGELIDIGSSPEVYQFSADPHYIPSIDPYPDEKRYIIKYQEMIEMG
jgi:hypothetical protein